MHRRAEILQQLTRFEGPTEVLLRELLSFEWEWNDAPLLVLTKQDFIRVMDRFLAGQISATQLQDWAEKLEEREDVAFDGKHSDCLSDVFFCLANPVINEPLTPEVVQRMRDELMRLD